MHKANFTLLFLFLAAAQYTTAQTTIVKDSVADKNSIVVIAGKQYDKSRLHQYFWGKHYRKEWATAVRVNKFYLDTAMGGLMIDKPSGSRQSMGLRLKKKDGKEYVLRSIDKDFGNGLPEIFQHTFISNIAKDQASIGYPFAAITITPMAEASGIYHTNPFIVFVPKQNALGDYNKEYGDQLYLFEERPDDDQHDIPSFGNSKKVIGSEKLYENIFKDNDHIVDQKAFAKARLFDMFIGDWGRHADQWRWASFKENGKTIYKPIPRDRDQTYTIFDGFFPFIATNIAGGTQLESFHGDIKQISFFNKPGRELDRLFTNQLTEKDWVDMAIILQQALTDKIIENAMHQLPPAIFSINGNKIIKQLQSRRDHLQDFAHRYYKFLARKIEVYGSADKEFFEINRIDQNKTQITVYKIKKDGSKSEAPIFSRMIFKNETKDVHLFGFKDADVFKIDGNGSNGVKVRLIGVSKSDSVIDNTAGRDTKTKIYRGKSDRYDSVFQKKIAIAPILFMNPKIFNVFDDDPLQLFTRRGIHAGLAVAFHPSPWKKDSLETVHSFAVNYGFTRKIWTAEYVGFAPERIGKWNLIIKARYDFPASESFFGIGNESKDSAFSSYYNVFSKRLYAGIGVNRKIGDQNFDVSLFYQSIKVDKNEETYIKDRQVSFPVFINRKYAGAELGYAYQNINSKLIPTKGIKLTAGGAYIMDIDRNGDGFFKANYAIAAYQPLGKTVSVASTIGGGYVSKDVNYYYMSKLKGNMNLRGFDGERFYGRTSFYNDNEIRILTNTHNILFNGKVGLMGFFDNGRVWQPGENSDTWHTGYGGGLIVSPFNKVVFIGTYEVSKDGKGFAIRTGMYF